MKKVLILYTGGTIGMNYTKDGLQTEPGLFSAQIKLLAPVSDLKLDLVEFDPIIDSSEITNEYWIKIIEHIRDYYTKYNGFVIVHGTDTMAYTASILSFALRGLNKPVILTGAQLPMVHRRSDGWRNLTDAIYSAIQPDLYEVAIVFNHKLFRGCRTQKVSANRFIGFNSVDEEPLAEFGIEIAWYKKRWLKRTKLAFLPIFPLPVKVLNLCLRPGYTTDFITDTLNICKAQAIILQIYGSGTIPIKNKQLTESLINATKRGVILVGITQVIEGRVNTNYANSRLKQFGIISGCDMTPEAALAKLTILLSTKMTINKIKNLISFNLVGELTELT